MLMNCFLGDDVSRLGFGAMRLPVVGQDQADIDQEALDAMVDAAIDAGVNYFDTAYPYHGNMSEIALGRSLARHPRDSFFLATKYPGHQISVTYDPAAIFEEQLQKCGVDRFDFYLLHNIYEASIDVYMDPQWRIVDYFIEQKRNGRIRHLGFSCHGRPETLRRFIEYGKAKHAELDEETAAMFDGDNVMEFCQIQLNYLDWSLQNAEEKCAILKEAGIPVVVMEPLRGGKMAAFDDEQAAFMERAPVKRSAVEWSFRWLQDIPEVKVILSGMSNLAQVEENCACFESADPLAEEEGALLLDVAETMKKGVPCTACRYCTDTCPQEIDIPVLLGAYNDLQYTASFTVSMQMDAVPEGQRASDCIACGVCTTMCPQGIDVPAALDGLAAALEKLPKWADLCRQREEAAARSRG